MSAARLSRWNRSWDAHGPGAGPYAHAVRFAYSRLYTDSKAHSDRDTSFSDQNSSQPNSNSDGNAHADSYACAGIYAEYKHNSLAYPDARANVRSSFG